MLGTGTTASVARPFQAFLWTVHPDDTPFANKSVKRLGLNTVTLSNKRLLVEFPEVLLPFTIALICSGNVHPACGNKPHSAEHTHAANLKTGANFVVIAGENEDPVGGSSPHILQHPPV